MSGLEWGSSLSEGLSVEEAFVAEARFQFEPKLSIYVLRLSGSVQSCCECRIL